MKSLAIYLKAVFAAAAGCLLAACTLESGEVPPRATQGEYAVYDCVRMLNARAASDIEFVCGFDRYLGASTEAERQAVRDRFFPFMQVSGSDGGWSLSREGLRYDFVLSEGLRLGEPGAEWTVWLRQESSSERQRIGTFATEDGGVRCKMNPYFSDSEIDWSTTVEITEDDVRITVRGSGALRIPWGGDDSWNVAYATQSAPLVWSGSEFVAGELSVEATLSGASRRIAFVAAVLEENVVRIDAGERSEVWGAENLRDGWRSK